MRFTKMGAVLALVSSSVMATPPDEIRYSFLDLGLTGGQIEVDSSTEFDYGVATVSGSWGVSQNIALFAGVGAGTIDVESEGFCCDIDTRELTIGISPHFPLARNVDLVIPVGLLWAEFDGGSFSDDDTGYSIGIGIPSA